MVEARVVAHREDRQPHGVELLPRSAESMAMLSVEHRAVVTALGSLPRRQREVLVLRYFAEMSEAEIAEAVGVSRGTVKSTAARGVRALGERLRAEDRV